MEATTKERPILMSAPMVRATLAGTKTQTRRVVKPQPEHWQHLQPMWGTSPPPNPVAFGRPGVVRPVAPDWPDGEDDDIMCPYGQPGDTLWVRETWQAIDGNERARRIMTKPNPSRGWIEYAATVLEGHEPPPRWRPSIHMPRWASRITLEITGLRVERLLDISEADAMAEGITYGPTCDEEGRSGGYHWDRTQEDECVWPVAAQAYRHLWERINGPGSWAANPWVWVIEFRRICNG